MDNATALPRASPALGIQTINKHNTIVVSCPRLSLISAIRFMADQQKIGSVNLNIWWSMSDQKNDTSKMFLLS